MYALLDDASRARVLARARSARAYRDATRPRPPSARDRRGRRATAAATVAVPIDVHTRVFGARARASRSCPVGDEQVTWGPLWPSPACGRARRSTRRTPAAAARDDPRARRQGAGRGPGRPAQLAARRDRRARSPATLAPRRPRRSAARSTRAGSRRHAGRQNGPRASVRGPAGRPPRRARCSPAARVIARARRAPAHAGAHARSTRASRRRRSRRSPAASAASRRSTRATARSARSPGSPSPRPSRPARRSRSSPPTAALEAGIVKPSTRSRSQTAATIDGVELENANGESCGGTFATASPHSCNSVFAPLGVKVGAKRSWDGRALRLEREPTRARRGAEHAAAGRRDQVAARGRLDRDRPGQGRSPPRSQMASVAQTIASARRAPVADALAGRPAERAGVTRADGAPTIETLMLGVVALRHRHGRGAARRQGRRQDRHGRAAGHARPRDRRDARLDPSNTDAWFAAYAPAAHPSIAVGGDAGRARARAGRRRPRRRGSCSMPPSSAAGHGWPRS